MSIPYVLAGEQYDAISTNSEPSVGHRGSGGLVDQCTHPSVQRPVLEAILTNVDAVRCRLVAVPLLQGLTVDEFPIVLNESGARPKDDVVCPLGLVRSKESLSTVGDGTGFDLKVFFALKVGVTPTRPDASPPKLCVKTKKWFR